MENLNKKEKADPKKKMRQMKLTYAGWRLNVKDYKIYIKEKNHVKEESRIFGFH